MSAACAFGELKRVHMLMRFTSLTFKVIYYWMKNGEANEQTHKDIEDEINNQSLKL